MFKVYILTRSAVVTVVVIAVISFYGCINKIIFRTTHRFNSFPCKDMLNRSLKLRVVY